jgi:hypothetical protein
MLGYVRFPMCIRFWRFFELNQLKKKNSSQKLLKLFDKGNTKFKDIYLN